jgi:hypothetical protein
MLRDTSSTPLQLLLQKIFSPPPPPTGSHFNCGVTVIPLPSPPTPHSSTSFPFLPLYMASMKVISDPKWNDTEEKMLNVVLPNWKGLPIRWVVSERAPPPIRNALN